MKKFKQPKKRNLIAKDLWTPKYRMRVVEDKRRKVNDKFTKQQIKKESYDSFCLHLPSLFFRTFLKSS